MRTLCEIAISNGQVGYIIRDIDIKRFFMGIVDKSNDKESPFKDIKEMLGDEWE